MAQNRKKRHDFPSVSAIIKEVTQNQTYYDTTEKQQKYLVETYEKMHTSYERNNNMRSAFVKVSMCCFYISIALCLFWFLTAIYIIL